VRLTPEEFKRLTPEAFWSFNDCRAGQDVLDSSPGRNKLALKGALCVPGKYGQGLGLDGANSMAETEGDAPSFTDRLTISAWVFHERVSGTQAIVREGSTPGSYGLFIVGGSFMFSVAFPGEVTHHVFAPAPVGQWSHVTGVYDGAAKSIKIYINGDEHSEQAFTEQPPLQPSTRPVVMGSNSSWNAFRGKIDEVALYDAVFTADEVRKLASQDEPLYFGSDSSVHPEDGDRFSDEELGYDFYGGRLGRWLEGGGRLPACRIADYAGNDVITGEPVSYGCQAFIYEAALIARPERTYGFWWMAGPDHDDARPFKRPGRDLSGFGWEQALRANSQFRTYNHVVGGRTIFADVERCISCPAGEDSSGWAPCEPESPNACKDNRAVLEGFLKGVAERGLTPGVYTGAERWNEFFGKNYIPTDGSGKPIPFVLWLTGFNTTDNPTHGKPRPPDEVEEDFHAAEAAGLGSMRTVIWQHHINLPDWDVMRQNPSGNFMPRPGLMISGGTWVDREPGLIGTGFVFNPILPAGRIPEIQIQGPEGWNGGSPFTCGGFQHPGTAAHRAMCWDAILPVNGEYTARAFVGGEWLKTTLSIDASQRLSPPEITDLKVSPGQVTFEWSASSAAKSFLVRVNPDPFTGTITGERVVSGGSRRAALSGLSLLPGARYQAVVWGFSHDVRTPGAFADQFNLGSDDVFFTAPTPETPTHLTATADANTLRDRWIQLQWERVQGTVTYNVYRSQTSPVPTDNAHRIASALQSRRYRDRSVSWETAYFYVVTAVDAGGNSSPPSGEASARLVLFDNVQVVPNPFTPDGDGVDDVTRIAYTLALPPQENRVAISAEILDSGGNLVQRLEVRPPVQGRGRHSVRWNGRSRNGTVAPVGLYTFRLTARSTSGQPPVVVRRSGEVQLARGSDRINLSYFYSFGDLSGTATVLPGDTFTIWNQPWEGSIFHDIAQCRTNRLKQISAYNHDRLSENGPGTLGPWVSQGCSEAEEFGYVVRCCVLP